jgi:hypothetical protein
MKWQTDRTLIEMLKKSTDKEMIYRSLQDLRKNHAWNFMMKVVEAKSEAMKKKMVNEIKDDDGLRKHNNSNQIVKMLDSQLEMVEHIRLILDAN